MHRFHNINVPSGNSRVKHCSIPAFPDAAALHVLYRHLTRQAAKPRCVRYSRRKRRSANSVAASCPPRSIAASQRQQRRSAEPASQRCSANSVARAWQHRSVTASPTPAWQRRSVATQPAPQSVAASQRHSGASQRNVGNPRFRLFCPSTVLSFV